MTDDRRRRQYVPLATHFATARTGTRLQQEFGAEGLAVWCCTLAAAKKSQVQGTIYWASEAEAWALLGLTHSPVGFTFQEFVAVLGKMKQASTRRVGAVSETTLSRFSEWNQNVSRDFDAAKKRRKRGQTTRDNRPDDTTPLGGTEGEVEGEPPYPLQMKNGTAAPCPHCGEPHIDLQGHLEDVHGQLPADLQQPDPPQP